MPSEKPWTMIFYLVAQAPPGLSDPVYMNTKVGEVIDAIKAAAVGRDLYVAYRVIPDPSDPGATRQFAEVLNADPSVADPSRAGPFFTSGSTDTWYQSDMREFFNWAIDRCPARRFAIFFWGHSFGPAGIFQTRTEVRVPDLIEQLPLASIGPLTTKQLGRTLRQLRDGRLRVLPAGPLPRVPLWRRFLMLPFPLGGQRSVEPQNKLQMVLFQDCWMSTMETAFELRREARFVVASQSLVPFGKPSVPVCGVAPVARGAGVWNYGEIFDHLVASDPADPLAGSQRLLAGLGAFYDANQTANAWPFASLPFTLLDLHAVDGENMRQSIIVLIDTIKRVKPTKETRAALFEAASIAALGPSACLVNPEPELTGSIALVDVKRLCRQLLAEALRPDERAAIDALLNTTLIVATHESVDRSVMVTKPDEGEAQGRLDQNGLGFEGISIYYCPSAARQLRWGKRDQYIYPALNTNADFYNGLELTEQTNPVGEQDGWGMELAFDQIRN